MQVIKPEEFSRGGIDGNGRTASVLYNRRGGEVGGEGWVYDSFDPEQDEWINRAD